MMALQCAPQSLAIETQEQSRNSLPKFCHFFRQNRDFVDFHQENFKNTNIIHYY